MRYRGTCWLRHLGGCGGGYEWHHHVRQQTIKRHYPEPVEYAPLAHGGLAPITFPLDTVLNDERIIDDTCTRHHELITCKALVIVRDDLPYAVEDWAHDFGMERLLDLEYGQWGDLAAAIAKRTGYLRKVVEAWMGDQRVRIAGQIAPFGSTVPPSGMRDVTLDGRAVL